MLFSLIIIFQFNLFADEDISKLESQPDVLFKYKDLKKNQKMLSQQVEFNNAVLLLEKGEYLKAIDILKDTSKFLKIPSYLNIGIAYYKLNSIHNAKVYLERIYSHDAAITEDTYSYMSACYYLYLISDNQKFLKKIIQLAKTKKDLSEHAKRLIADTFIILKDYKMALSLLDTMDYASDFKKGLLLIKLKDYEKADLLLRKAYENNVNLDKKDKILWFMVFSNLKSNNLEKLNDNLDLIQARKSSFEANKELELKMFFNKNKYTPDEYFKFITKFDLNRKIDFIYYFAPYIFSDNEEIMYDSTKGFIFKDKSSLDNLDDMISYNASFLKLIKKDPIQKVAELKKMLNKDTKSYIYYNLALSYAQIDDFYNALKYFEQATKLNPGNKLYSAMTLITAIRSNTTIADKDYLDTNIKLKKGMYQYFGQKIYNLIINDKIGTSTEPKHYAKTIFYKALNFLPKFNEGTATLDDPLIKDNFKEPLTFLLKEVIKRENENDFTYFSRLQDTVPLKINNNFLDGSILITQYYVDLLKALGLFNKADFSMQSNITPTYLRTKALKLLHDGYPKKALNLIETLQSEYKLEDKYTMYLVVASYLDDNRYNDASVQISLIKGLLKDSGADFLTGVQLIQELKISSAKQFFLKPYLDDMIDFKIEGFDKFLESL
ncbi:tetratricopeptide repeat protein [Arcobacter sp.]|uniref:tetratricopeptide repeat protein n=1 Tax=unclassified Arcobacter TaxID=2593671 RepID=UPI003B008DF2